jgi:hypothetical protein
MTEATLFVFLILIGGLSLAFAIMAFLADVILPAIARHRWRTRRLHERIERVKQWS